jgi:putative transposase
MRAFRALLIKLPRDKCDVGYIKRLMALANLAYRGFEVWEPDIPKTIQHHLYGFRNFRNSLIFGTSPKAWFARTWLPLKTRRVYVDGAGEGDPNAPVVLDFIRDIIRIRLVCRPERGFVLELPMPGWVVKRVKEGGDIKFVRIGLKDGEPYLALVAERVVEPYEPSDYKLVVDVNSWRYGIAWGLIHNGRIVSFRQERPNLGLLMTLYNEAVQLERKAGKLRRLNLDYAILRKQAKARRGKIYRITRDKAYFLAGKLVRKALRYRALLVIDDVTEESRRELIEEKLPPGVIKLLMANTRKLIKQLTTLAEWYGVPYEFKRLPSKVCPVCQHELTQLPGRTMVCENCGFKAPRDKVPIHWAMKL